MRLGFLLLLTMLTAGVIYNNHLPIENGIEAGEEIYLAPKNFLSWEIIGKEAVITSIPTQGYIRIYQNPEKAGAKFVVALWLKEGEGEVLSSYAYFNRQGEKVLMKYNKKEAGYCKVPALKERPPLPHPSPLPWGEKRFFFI